MSCISKDEYIENEAELAGISNNVAVVVASDPNTDDDELGISMEKLTLGIKKKLVVLPIGGFLVHRAHSRRPNTIPKDRLPDFSYKKFKMYRRPYCEGFLKFCFERFEVGIWSSAKEHNIDVVLSNVMGELESKLLFKWDQQKCKKTRFMCADNKQKPVFLKKLDYLWKKKHSYHGWSAGEYSASNTLLISDPVAALLNPPNTVISPSEYDPENKQDDFLGPDSELRMFLEGLAEAKDVQSYVKAHPIGDPTITSSHADWNYYSRIIRAYAKTS